MKRKKRPIKLAPKPLIIPHKLQSLINIYRDQFGHETPYDWRYVFAQTVRIDYKDFCSWDK